MPASTGQDSAAISSILFESPGVFLLDIPRSLEEGQVLPGERPRRRICSGAPPIEPFSTPDPRKRPKDGRSRRHGGAAHSPSSQSNAAQINDLMTTATVESALQELRDKYSGEFLYPRISPAPASKDATATALLPVDNATPLNGSIRNLRQTLIDTAPLFKLVVLDPPWPNRSARRRTDQYATASNLSEMRNLLTDIPISTHLAEDGLVAIWITNKTSIPDLLTSPRGVFAAWGVELCVEWTWLKITASGEPLYDVNSAWRKPWEKILIAKRIGAPCPRQLKSKVIIAVPDAHSRKPNLRRLFEAVFGQQEYAGLEIFARNLTAGWWSWGDEVSHFQSKNYWNEGQHEDDHGEQGTARIKHAADFPA